VSTSTFKQVLTIQSTFITFWEGREYFLNSGHKCLQTQKGKRRNVFEGLLCLSVPLCTSAHLLVSQRKKIRSFVVKRKN